MEPREDGENIEVEDIRAGGEPGGRCQVNWDKGGHISTACIYDYFI